MKSDYFKIAILTMLIFASNGFAQDNSAIEKSGKSKWKVVVTDNLSSKKTESGDKKKDAVEAKQKTETAVNKEANSSSKKSPAPVKTGKSVFLTQPQKDFPLDQPPVLKSKKTSPDEKAGNEKSSENHPTAPAKKLSEWEKTWSILAKFSASFDTNLEHDPVPARAFGFVPSLTAGYQIKSSNQRLKFIYSFAAPRYSIDTDLNRFGNYFAASYRYSLGKWNFETDGEISLKGTNEDRETNDQYILTETIGYRFDNKTRLNVYGAYRIRRFPTDDADRNAVNPMLGLKFSRKLSKGIDWNIAYRYDENRAVSPRQNYIRTTYKTGFDIEINNNNLFQTEISYRPRRYKNRLVEIGETEVLRRDKKWSFDAVWKHNFSRRWGFEAGYQFENQNSNDMEKIYRNHQFVFSIFYHWGNGDVIKP